MCGALTAMQVMNRTRSGALTAMQVITRTRTHTGIGGVLSVIQVTYRTLALTDMGGARAAMRLIEFRGTGMVVDGTLTANTHIESGDRFTKVRIQLESPWQSDDIRRGCLQVKYVPDVCEELSGVVDIRTIREKSMETWDFTVLAHILAYNEIWGWLLTDEDDRWFINQLRLHRNSICHASNTNTIDYEVVNEV